MHSVSQWPNLRHLGESLGGAEGLLEAVSFKKVTKGMGTRSIKNARWECVPYCQGCNTKTTGDQGSANSRNRQQVGVCRAKTACGSVVINKGVEASRLSGVEVSEMTVNAGLSQMNWKTVSQFLACSQPQSICRRSCCRSV